MKDKRLATIFAVVFVDLLGFSLILPLLPYYAEKYGATPAVVGLLVASYALAQLIGAPLLGRLSDRYGRRPILLVSIAGTVIGFLLLAFAEPIAALLPPWLYLSAADFLAIGAGTWTIDPAQTTGVLLGGVLPIEEVIFFLLTNVLIVFGMVLLLGMDRSALNEVIGRLHRNRPESA